MEELISNVEAGAYPGYNDTLDRLVLRNTGIHSDVDRSKRITVGSVVLDLKHTLILGTEGALVAH